MAYQFYIRQYDRAGNVKRLVIDDFLSLTYRRAVNEPGRLDFLLRGQDEVVAQVEDYDLFEVWWKNDKLNIPWHSDFEGILLKTETTTDDDGVTTFKAKCLGQMAILSFRQIGYPSGRVGFTTFAGTPAETVMKTLVTQNATSAATIASGRIREGDLFPGMGFLVVPLADLGRGNAIDRTFYNTNLLRALSDNLADIAGGDFSFPRVPAGGVNARWELEFFPGQLGTDKTSGPNRVEFSDLRANMRKPKLVVDKFGEATVSLAAGQGQGADRFYTEVLGTDYSPSRDIEMLTDARQEPTSSGVINSAQRGLDAQKEQVLFDFDVIQTEAVFYSRIPVAGRKTYTLGDLVEAVYQGLVLQRKIYAITVSIRVPGRKDVEIDVATERI